MIFRIIYEPSQYQRIIQACLIDSRAAIPAIANQVGSVIKAYTDTQVSMIDNLGLYFFKVETGDGVLAGYFSISVNTQTAPTTVTIVQKQLRPAFYQFVTQISAEISNFINTNAFQQYVL